ncbi:hypothetical protein ANN_01043 [Periplaneta americana]|uniref:Uncharacterized protein n=1 Tax=Periplaneta americana TaxID=6978 RepID=A0ABQ8TSL4_PERAM|nr:hypothetical protein ANN_01043 [Periplaneta americana]
MAGLCEGGIELPGSLKLIYNKMKFIKAKHRSHLTNVNLEYLLRISVTNQPARIDKIVLESSRVRPSTSQQ